MWLLVLSLLGIFEFQEMGGFASLLSAQAAVVDIPVLASFNPSLQLESKKSGIVFTFTKPYSLSDLKYLKISLWLKRWGIGFSSAGLMHPGYGEWIFSLSKGLPLFKSLSLGFLLSFYHLSIPNYESDFFFSLSPSLSFIQERFLISFIILHTNQPKTLYGEVMPLTFILGIGVPLRDGIDFYFDYEREREEAMRGGLKFGYKILYGGIGFANNPISFTSGFGLALNNFNFSYGLKWHSHLRESHILSLELKSFL